MINVYTVSFFGHRELSDAFEAERRLEKLVGELKDAIGDDWVEAEWFEDPVVVIEE